MSYHAAGESLKCFGQGAPPLVKVNYYRYFYLILLIQHSTVIRIVFVRRNQRWKRECQFLIDCQALNQIKSNPKSILSKVTLWGQTLKIFFTFI